MQESPIRKLTPIAEAAKKRGIKVYHLNVGQPDIETPEGFMTAVRNFDEKTLTYALSEGSNELIQAVIDYYKNYNMYFEKNQVLITIGGSEALMFALIGITDFGEEVLAPEPFYTNYNGFSTPIGTVIKSITTFAENGFMLPSKEEIVKLIGPKTRGILLSNPGNPTGAVYTKAEVEMIGEIAKENDLYIIADEVYREFRYDNLEYTSFGSLKDVEDRVIIVDSISKRYSACGARIGSILCKNNQFMASIIKLCQVRASAPTLEMLGAVELYKTPESYLKEVNEEYQKRRDITYNALMEIPGIVCKLPRGAFYVIAKLPVPNAEEFIIWMLGEYNLDGETVMLAPVADFYATKGLGLDEVRIAYVLKGEDLKRAIYILKNGLEEYKVLLANK